MFITGFKDELVKLAIVRSRQLTSALDEILRRKKVIGKIRFQDRQSPLYTGVSNQRKLADKLKQLTLLQKKIQRRLSPEQLHEIYARETVRRQRDLNRWLEERI